MSDNQKPPSLEDVRAGRATIRTPQGIYVPAEVAEKLKAYAEPPGLYEPGLSMLATPIYVLPPKPQPKKPSFWRRFWWSLTGRPRPIVERCHLVTIDLDGEQITIPVLAEQPMSDEGRAAFAEIIAAAKRKFDAEAGQRCAHTTPSVFANVADRMCTKPPHPDSPWHADGSGARWRQNPEAP